MTKASPRLCNFVAYPKAPAIVAVVLIVVYGVLKASGVPSTIRSSPGLWGGLAILTVVLLALYLQIKQVRTYESFWDRSFSIFLDVIFATAIAWYFSSVGLITAPPGASDFPIAFSVGVVILAVELISNSAGVAEDVQNNIQRMEDAANTIERSSKQIDRYKEVLSEAIYGPALHSALEVRMEELKAQDDDILKAPAIRAGIDTTRQWIAIGSRLSRNSAHRQSWWGLMETYHREERYDIARQELV